METETETYVEPMWSEFHNTQVCFIVDRTSEDGSV
jgi:hypothetical protein